MDGIKDISLNPFATAHAARGFICSEIRVGSSED